MGYLVHAFLHFQGFLISNFCAFVSLDHVCWEIQLNLLFVLAFTSSLYLSLFACMRTALESFVMILAVMKNNIECLWTALTFSTWELSRWACHCLEHLICFATGTSDGSLLLEFVPHFKPQWKFEEFQNVFICIPNQVNQDFGHLNSRMFHLEATVSHEFCIVWYSDYSCWLQQSLTTQNWPSFVKSTKYVDNASELGTLNFTPFVLIKFTTASWGFWGLILSFSFPLNCL